MSINNLRVTENFATMSGMSGTQPNRDAGEISTMLISLIAAIVLVVALASFGAWAFASRQDYKNNSDAKAAVAVAAAKRQTQATDAELYAEAAKSPLTSFVGPSQFGSVTVKYPKTWSVYTVENSTSQVPVNDYFHPTVVPDVTNADSAYALRVEILSQSYDSVLKEYASSATSGKVTIKPYALAKVPAVVGSRVDGQLSQTKQGSVIIVPLRNLTLKISTESNNFLPDFNNIILPNISFSP